MDTLVCDSNMLKLRVFLNLTKNIMYVQAWPFPENPSFARCNWDHRHFGGAARCALLDGSGSESGTGLDV